MINLKNLSQEEVILFCRSLGLPDYKGKQLFSWLYRPAVTSFDAMTDLAKPLRAKLHELAFISSLSVETIKQSSDGTRKFVFAAADDILIESVLIPDADRQTLCISSQAGCAMGCKFCVTGQTGFTRNLETSEIIDQVIAVRNIVFEEDDLPLSNIVFMGMGEPLANFDNVLKAISLLTDQRGLDFSERKITVSTCGISPKLNALGENTKVNLAISLHATNDELRNSLMPVNQTYPLKELLEACRQFPMPKRKRIMMEYTLLAGINDSREHALQLAKILHDIPCKINLLTYNANPSLPFQPPTKEHIEMFQDILRNKGYAVMLRNSRGLDIDAACGQLAGKRNSAKTS